MAVQAHAEQNQVAARGARLEDRPERRLVVRRGPRRVRRLSRDPEDLTRRHRHLAEERLPGHPVVRLGVGRRHTALVTKEDPRPAPVDARPRRLARERRVEPARGRAAGQRHREAAPVADRLGRGPDEELRRLRGEGGRRLDDGDPA